MRNKISFIVGLESIAVKVLAYHVMTQVQSPSSSIAPEIIRSKSEYRARSNA